MKTTTFFIKCWLLLCAVRHASWSCPRPRKPSPGPWRVCLGSPAVLQHLYIL